MKRFLFCLSSYFIFGILLGMSEHLEAGDAILYVADNLSEEDFNDQLEIYIGLMEENDNDIWLVVADPTPAANWGHRVIWHYISCEYDGVTPTVLRVEEHSLLPRNVEMFKLYYPPVHEMDIAPIPYVRQNVEKRNIPIATHQYAIILSGGIDAFNDYPRYWNDCSYIFTALKNHFNVPQENIYVAMSEGPFDKDGQPNKRFSLDLDGDNEDDISYGASLEDLQLIFEELKGKLTPKDHLFLYVIDHGDYDKIKKSSLIYLWDLELLYPNTLNSWLNELSVGSINCVFGQCNSGGFVKPLKGENRVIATACSEFESSWPNSRLLTDAFVDSWVAGLLNTKDLNGESVETADKDGDNKINMEEAFGFAQYYDMCGPYGNLHRNGNVEHPQFYSGNDILSKDLCFDRHPYPFDLIIRDDAEDLGIEPYLASIVVNDSPDIWVRHDDDERTIHQNPVCTTPGEIENYIYVRVTNKGLFDYDPTIEKRYLHINWASAAPVHKYQSFAGQIADKEGNAIGSSIQTVLIDEKIPAGQEKIICVPWKTRGYVNELEDGPKSILASISNSPYGFYQDVWRNIYSTINYDNPSVEPKYHKNIAIKNSYSPAVTPSQGENEKNQCKWEMDLSNASNSQNSYSISFRSGNLNSLFDNVSINVKGPENFKVYATPAPQVSKNNKNVSRIVIAYDSINHNFKSINDKLQYLIFQENQVERFQITATPNANTKFTGNISAVMQMINYPNNEVIGTYTVNFSMTNGNINVQIPRIISKTSDGFTYSLSVDESNNQNISQIEWLDANNNILSRNEQFDFKCENTCSLKLKVRYEDGTENENSITITPFPTIKSCTKLSDGTVRVTLTNPTDKDVQITATSVDRPYLNYTFNCPSSGDIHIIPSTFSQTEHVVVSIQHNDVVVGSVLIK